MFANFLAEGLFCVCAFMAQIPSWIVRSLHCVELVGVYTFFLCMMDMLIDMDCLCFVFVLIHAYYGSLSSHLSCLINDNLVRDVQFCGLILLIDPYVIIVVMLC